MELAFERLGLLPPVVDLLAEPVDLLEGPDLVRRLGELQSAGVSVPSNIAEGSKRPDPDFGKFLTYSLGSLAELDTQFLIAEMQGYAKVHGRAQGEGRRSYGRGPRVLATLSKA